MTGISVVTTQSRKMKGVAHIRLVNGRVRLAELHRYEAHGMGEKRNKAQTIFGINYEEEK